MACFHTSGGGGQKTRYTSLTGSLKLSPYCFPCVISDCTVKIPANMNEHKYFIIP